MNRHTTVRVINPHEDTTLPKVSLPGYWVSMLERAGYLRVLKETDQHQVLEFVYPEATKYKNSSSAEVWAHQQAERFKSFGVNAVTAPPWRPK